jgi:hypothetical protein
MAIQPFNAQLAQRFVCLLARLRERIEVRKTGMAGFIIMCILFTMPVNQMRAAILLSNSATLTGLTR